MLLQRMQLQNTSSGDLQPFIYVFENNLSEKLVLTDSFCVCEFSGRISSFILNVVIQGFLIIIRIFIRATL